MSGYAYDQMVSLEWADPNVQIWVSDKFIPRRSYVRTRYGDYLKVIRIVSQSNGTFYYLCEFTFWGVLRTIFASR